MSTDSINPFEPSAFDLSEDDLKDPVPEQWPPAEEHWPARPPLHERVQQRPDFWQALSNVRK